jgi:hypothetical protein
MWAFLGCGVVGGIFCGGGAGFGGVSGEGNRPPLNALHSPMPFWPLQLLFLCPLPFHITRPIHLSVAIFCFFLSICSLARIDCESFWGRIYVVYFSSFFVFFSFFLPLTFISYCWLLCCTSLIFWIYCFVILFAVMCFVFFQCFVPSSTVGWIYFFVILCSILFISFLFISGFILFFISPSYSFLYW